MRQEQLEHLIRASGAIIGDKEIVVIGSQSILPWLTKFAGKPPRDWPGIFTLSSEADIIPIDNSEEKSNLIDGTLGEDSYFHKMYGVYAQGVSMETAVAPDGWFARCFRLVNQNTMEIAGWCMHPADLFIAKSVANREKDWAFLDAMIAYRLARKETVLHLLPKVHHPFVDVELLHKNIVSRFEKIGESSTQEFLMPEDSASSQEKPADDISQPGGMFST